MLQKNTLAVRINVKGIEAKTFHKLGKDIIVDCEARQIPIWFKDQGEYIQYLKDQNFKTYKAKGINRNGKLTYRMEVVKSIEECRIANFLLFNNVAYEYEYPYEVETVTDSYRQYKPNFTIRLRDEVSTWNI